MARGKELIIGFFKHLFMCCFILSKHFKSVLHKPKHILESTQDSGINVGSVFINSGFFSRPYSLIKRPYVNEI